MNQTSNRHVFLLLLEIMIAILFFALTSAVCLRVFAKSHTLSSGASDINFASSNLSNVAELLKSADRTRLDDANYITDTLSLGYDTVSESGSKWILSCDDYQILITEDPVDAQPSVCTFQITVQRTADQSEIDHLLLELYAEE